nr:putative integron gene cassette protein [uncultured bacterium]
MSDLLDVTLLSWMPVCETFLTRTNPSSAGGTPSSTKETVVQDPERSESVKVNPFDFAEALSGAPFSSVWPQSMVVFKPLTVEASGFPNRSSPLTHLRRAYVRQLDR